MTTQYVLLAAVIAGMTEFIGRLRGQDYWTALTIGCAAIIGGLFGWQHVEGLTVASGIAAGFGASGGITALGHITNVTSTVASKAFGARKNG